MDYRIEKWENIPRGRSRYSEGVMKAAIECGQDECVVKSFDSKQNALAFVNTLYVYKRNNCEKWTELEGIDIVRRDCTVYVHWNGGCE